MNVVILCDGAPPPEKIFKEELAKCGLFIAADGGAVYAQHLEADPDVIIGDLDSYTVTGNEPGRVIKDPDQETNDLEKALQYAKQKGAGDIVVFGATGKRLDQTLKNLSVLKQFNDHFNSLIFRDLYSDIFLIKSPYKSSFPTGTTLSLFPLSGRVEGITTSGLKYPLYDETLENGIRDGSSNETIENNIEITFDRGDLLLFVITDTPAS
ncbi:MAG: thiamine diphosphokinase [Balneolaceae bacterium]